MKNTSSRLFWRQSWAVVVGVNICCERFYGQQNQGWDWGCLHKVGAGELRAHADYFEIHIDGAESVVFATSCV